jgi:hypothetical protein
MCKSFFTHKSRWRRHSGKNVLHHQTTTITTTSVDWQTQKVYRRNRFEDGIQKTMWHCRQESSL